LFDRLGDFFAPGCACTDVYVQPDRLRDTLQPGDVILYARIIFVGIADEDERGVVLLSLRRCVQTP